MLQILKAAHLEREQDCPVQTLQTLQSKARDVELIREQATMHVELNPDPDDKPKDDRDSTSAHSDNSSLEDVLENLKSDVDALIELGPCLEDPIQDTLVAEAPASPPQVTADSYKYQTFFEGIKQKFPQCDDDLARALSKAFYDTTMRLHLERQTASCEAVEQPEVTSKLPKDSGYQTSLKDPSREPESFHESSVATGSSYARTLASYADVDDGTTRTPFPSQPKDLKIGENFRCVACGRQVAKSESGAAWRYAYTYYLVRPLLGAVANNFTDDICSRICDRGSVAKCPAIVPVHLTIRGTSGLNIFKPNMRFILTGTIRSARSASVSSPREDAR
jgi:hypothetical protein